MSRSFIYLRRALFGTSCVIVFGLGANQALAVPQQGTGYGECLYGDPGADAYCTSFCRAEKLGYYGVCAQFQGGRCGCL